MERPEYGEEFGITGSGYITKGAMAGFSERRRYATINPLPMPLVDDRVEKISRLIDLNPKLFKIYHTKLEKPF